MNDVSSSKEKSSSSPRKRRSFLTGFLRKLLIVGVISILMMYGLSMSAGKPESLGVNAGRLAPCPDKPNCVSTMASDEAHKMDALDMSDVEAPMDKVKSVVGKSFSRAKLIEESENYCHFEFSSLIFRFVDDVEFYLDENQVLHFRSASRTGHSDMGVNRNRMAKIAEALKGLKNE